LIDDVTMKEKVLGFRNIWIYMSVIIVPIMVSLDEKFLEKVLRIFKICGVMIALFGIVQFLFYSSLPDKLKYLSIGGSEFGLAQYAYKRANGLIGNPLQYGTFTLMITGLVYAGLIKRRNKIDILLLIVLLFGTFVSFSRAAIYGIVLVLSVINLLSGKSNLISFGKYALIAFTIFLMLNPLLQNMIKERLTIFGSMNVGSNVEHIYDIKNSLEYIYESPLTGAGLGTQGSSSTGTNKIITDGYWFGIILELGLPLFLLFLFIWGLIIRKIKIFHQLFKTSSFNLFSTIFFSWTVLFIIGNFINTSFDRINYIIYWLFAGIVISHARYMNNNNTIFKKIL